MTSLENNGCFCGEELWSSNLTWYTDNPDFSQCFQQSVLVLLPCCLFSIIALINAWTIYRRSVDYQSPWFAIPCAKLIICIFLMCLSIAELAVVAVQTYMGLNTHNVLYYSNFSKIISYVLATYLVILNKRCAVKSSTVLTLFWFTSSICGLIMYRSVLLTVFYKELSTDHIATYIINMMYFPFVFVQLFLSLFPDVTTPKSVKDPFEDAPFFSFVTVHWFNRYIFLGQNKLLSLADFSGIPPRLKAENLWDTFAGVLNKVKSNPKANAENKERKEISWMKLVSAMIKAFQRNFTFALLLHFISVALTFVPSLILDILITFMSSSDYLWHGIFYAVLLFVADFLGRTANNTSMFYSTCFGEQARSVLVSAVYRKATKLSSAARQDYTIGEMVNLMSVDIQKIEDFFRFFPFVIGSPAKIIITLFLLWQYLGPSCLAGVVVLCVLLIANAVMIKKCATVQKKQMEIKDSRLKFFTELLNGIKVLKLYAWEIPFINKITDIRKVEVSLIRTFQICCAILSFVWGCGPFLIAVVCFLTFILVDSKNVLDPRIAFVSLNLLNILRHSVMDVPVFTSELIQVSVSLKRLSKFLNSEEYDEEMIGKKPDVGEKISIRNATFSWARDGEPTLKDINFHVPKGSLIAVIGPVGSGKSSLLSAILGEMYKLSGTIDVEGSFAYVPQQAWILNRTVKENIIFVKTMNRPKYKKILEDCCLEADLDILPARDNTEIGEKGINLSGGQKQRISLARAIYHDADIYLLDDPLSAVDANVGKHIFDRVIGKNGSLKRKTRILVTHNISNLHQADRIYTLRDGRIEENGTYDELMSHGGLFYELIQEYSNVKVTVKSDSNVISVNTGEPSNPLPNVERSVSVQEEFKQRTTSVDSTVSTAAGGTLIEEEKMEVGKVKIEAFLSYIRHMGLPVLICVVIGYISREALEVGGNVWLSKWSSDQQLPDGSQNIPLRNKRLGVYAGIGFFQCTSILFGAFSLAFGSSRASKSFHKLMLDSVMKSPMSFFDTTPLGRIINRFGRDIDDIDIKIPQLLDGWLVCLFSVAGTFGVIASGTPIFLAFCAPLMIVYYFIQKVYLKTSLQLRRLRSVAQSPLYSHFTETIQGSSSIRSYKVENQFHRKSEEKLDTSVMFIFYWIMCNLWLQIRLSVIGDIVIFTAAVLAVMSRGSLDSAVAALSLTYAFSVNDMLNWLVRRGAALETRSVSVERVVEYSKLPSEAPWITSRNFPPPSWPSTGIIEFKDYSTRYREKLDLILRNVNLKICDSEKVGVVGRTGAGKSSLTLALFRILEPAGGSIIIDDVDVSKIGLHQLRSKLTVIPQDPVLFTGHLRVNLDPNNQHSDQEIWSCLDHANLKSFVKSLPEGLQHEISEGGGNLSVGQRQLVCLARALLKKTRVLILDEATAAVDVETDQLIQNTIRNEFKDYTVITVAHRLNTIMDYDRIIVMESGKIAEVGSPSDLLKDPDSKFYAMAKDAGLV